MKYLSMNDLLSSQTDSEQFWSWLDTALTSLSNFDKNFFRQYWIKRKYLRFQNAELDLIDEYSTHLICSALIKRKSLFVVFPDFKIHRPSVLFATALIKYCRYSKDRITHDNSGCKLRVLYFGSTVGIREQLKHITVGEKGKNLADLFQNQYLNKHNYTKNKKDSILKDRRKFNNLPEVITIYSPVDPVAAIEQYEPQWIAIDCGDIENLDWLQPLLDDAIQKNISVISWGYNSLSKCVESFYKHSLVWIWPIRVASRIDPCSQKHQKLQSLLQTSVITRIKPIIIECKANKQLESSFQEANRLLVRSFKFSQGRLAQDALKVHWQYLRTLELLSVPFEFYELESSKFYKMKSFSLFNNECEYFRKACYPDYPKLAAILEEANTQIEAIHNHLKTNDESPIWLALRYLLFEKEKRDKKYAIIFNNKVIKNIFLSAIQFFLNKNYEELTFDNIFVFSFDELNRKVIQQNRFPAKEQKNKVITDLTIENLTENLYPILVGLPSLKLTPKLLPISLYENVDMILYSHQTSGLACRVKEWEQRVGTNFYLLTKVLNKLSGIPEPPKIPSLPCKFELMDIERVNVVNGRKKIDVGVKPIWQPDDPVEEVARLLQLDKDTTDDELRITEESKPKKIEKTQGTGYLTAAIEVYFEQGWHACFDAQDTIYVIVASSGRQRTEECFVRSLKPGNRVIAIPGQQRQNLYDLIISRIHRHPTFELHLALISRWQEDFISAYQHWQQQGRSIVDLLKKMQLRGSTLTSTVALYHWLDRKILCPDDAEDLRRLAEILNISFVRSYYGNIDLAAKRLRSLHRSLSRRLNSWLEQQVTGSVGKMDEDLIDPELDLTFSDFRSSLIILQVVEVRNITGLFLRDSLGKFERDI